MGSTPRLDELPSWSEQGAVHVVIETPRGSGAKLKFDPELGAMTLSRPLPLGVVYPFDFGFVPRTRAEDGDPLDAAVLLDVATFPGVVLRCRLIGLVRASQKGSRGGRVRNDRLITIAEGDRRRAHVREAADLPRTGARGGRAVPPCGRGPRGKGSRAPRMGRRHRGPRGRRARGDREPSPIDLVTRGRWLTDRARSERSGERVRSGGSGWKISMIPLRSRVPPRWSGVCTACGHAAH